MTDERAALERIERYGYGHPGLGFTCARMASVALGNKDRRPDLPLPEPPSKD